MQALYYAIIYLMNFRLLWRIFMIKCLQLIVFLVSFSVFIPLSFAQSSTPDDGSVEKLFYDICVKEMVAGMKEGMSEGKDKDAADNMINDPKIMKSMNDMAEKVCKCATPKYKKVVVEAMNGPKENQTQAYFEKEAMKAIMDCM